MGKSFREVLNQVEQSIARANEDTKLDTIELLKALSLAEIANHLESIETILATGLTKGSPLLSTIDRVAAQLMDPH